MPQDIVDAFKVGPKAVVVADCDLRGDITLGPGTILQPRCTILAVSGPIIFGENNIVEDNVIIVNRHKQPMLIGDQNLFEVGCRVESPVIGSHNVFGIRSRVLPSVSVGNHCVVGAGCLVQADPFAAAGANKVGQSDRPSAGAEVPSETGEAAASSAELVTDPIAAAHPPPTAAPPTLAPTSTSDTLSDYTHVFGSENRRRKATNEGEGQGKALFAKHWEYLRDTLPRYHKLKMF
ncbi:hypothetical protein JCM10908_004586 [Rhodotorula pacifica]|uniref:dynactin subunit 6 n=1 Tax=Rhodotorula pacifica TaxID=1495444 RepID=UPI003173018E